MGTNVRKQFNDLISRGEDPYIAEALVNARTHTVDTTAVSVLFIGGPLDGERTDMIRPPHTFMAHEKHKPLTRYGRGGDVAKEALVRIPYYLEELPSGACFYRVDGLSMLGALDLLCRGYQGASR